MSEKKFSSIYFDKSVVYKRVKGFMTASLFLAGNLVSTLPVMAAPKPSANIVVDTAPPVNQRPTVDITHNGIDQVNIVHPNDAGVSHNKFNQYNVNEQGQILNNSPTITNTKLAGQITGNPHLKDGKTAHTIINEVTGYSPTKLLGYTEVAGKQAAVIFANPNGITCAGCGFINTSRASLATGKPNLDANGNLQSITVSGGEVGFDGAGGNFAEVPVLDIISRKVRINAPVNGQDIQVVAGRNTYDYANRTATPLSSDGSQAPEFAIETSTLGGMTGNHIQMLVNEKGAGVRVDGRMASTAGDMQLTADGKLVVSGELTAQNNLKVTVTTVENTGTIGATNTVSLQASSLRNTGKIVANGGQESNITLDNELDNSGSITAQSALKLKATKINNQQAGNVSAQNDLTLDGQNLTNNGEISSATGTIKATINGDISNNNGKIAANNSIDLDSTGDMSNQSGQIVGNQAASIHIKANNFNNQNGLIQTNTGIINLEPNSLNNNAGSIVTTNANITINASEYILNNNNAQIGSKGAGDISLITQNNLQNNNSKISTKSGSIYIHSNKLTNNSGTILAGIVNDQVGVTLRSGDIENSGGVIQATDGVIDAHIGSYTDTNAGLVYAGKNLTIAATDDVSIAHAIQSQQDLSVSAASLTLSNADASLSSLSGNSVITVTNALINAGSIFINKDFLSITAGSIQNSGNISIKKPAFDTDTKREISNTETTQKEGLNIEAKNGDIENRAGSITTKDDAIELVASGNIDNSSGQIGSQGAGNVTLQGNDINSQDGLIRTATGNISLTTKFLDNSNSGIILTTSGNVEVTAKGQGINNNSGQIGTQQSGNITIAAENGDINNSQGQFVTPSGLLTITTNTINNSNSGQIGSNNGNVRITSGRLSNSSGVIIAGADNNVGNLVLRSGDVDNSYGTIQSTNGFVDAHIGNYTDTGNGVIYAGNTLSLDASGYMSVAGAIQSQNQFTLSANSLNLTNKNALVGSLNGNGSLTTVNDLINNGNISFSKGSLALDTGSFGNYGSIDVGVGGFNFNVKGNFSNKNGSLITDASDVTITAKGTVDNTNGQIGVKTNGNVTINSQDLWNEGGLIRTTTGAIILNVNTLDNQNGSILITTGKFANDEDEKRAQGAHLQINASQNINNTAGKIAIQESGNIGITAKNGNVYNEAIGDSFGQIVTPVGFVHIVGENLNNNGGQIGALTAGDIRLSLQSSLINTNGKIITPSGTIVIDNGNFSNMYADISNTSGIIKATDGVIDAHIGGYTDTNAGLVYAGKNLTIVATGDVSIAHAIQSQQDLSVSAASLTLSNADASLSSLSGNSVITVTNALINAGSIFINKDLLSIIAGSIHNSGQISIKKLTSATDTKRDISNAETVKKNGLNIEAKNGDIDNRSGHIITSDSAIDLYASGTIDNSNAGQVGSQESNSITLRSQILNNQNGLIRTNNGNLTLTIGSLDNSNSGAILTTTGNILVDASQEVVNTLGKIGVEKQGNVTVNAKTGDLNNTQGKILTTAGFLDVDVYNLYNNSSGQIGSKNGAVDIIFKHLVNNSGVILAEKNGILDDSNVIEDNWGSVTLHGGDVDNSNGTIQATGGFVLANISNYTDTSSGVLYAGKNLTLSASGDVSIANAIQSQGNTVLSANQLILTNKEASVSSLQGDVSLNNINDIINNGSIYASLGSLNILQGGILENSGAVYGKQLVKLDLTQSIKNNGVIVDSKLDNGLIQSDGNVLLTARSLENTGFIQSIEGYITLAISGDIYNQSLADSSGVIKSGRTDKDGYGQYITITADNLQNTSGQILSDTDLTLNIQNTLTNGGYLQANKAAILLTPNLKNNGGVILALGGNLSIGSSEKPTVTAAIDNSNGKIQANGNIIINGSSYKSSEQSFLTAQQQLQANFTGDVVNNGQMVAGSELTFTANSLSNGTLGLIYSEIRNVSLTVLGQSGISNFGNIRAAGTNTQLLMNTSSLANQGTILAANSATLTVNQELNNQRDQNGFGKIITQAGDLTINAPTILNAGVIITPNNLTITTQTMNNTGYVSADDLLTVNASNSIVSQAASSGLSYDNQTLVSGSFVGGTVDLSSQDIQSQNGWIQGKNAVTLTANTIENTQQSVLLSTNGDVTLQGIGSTENNILPVASVTNKDSNIQAYNRLWIATKNLDNTNGVLTSESGNIRLDQGSSGSALQSFSNAGGTLQSSQDLTLNFSQLDSAEGSKILAGGLLSLTICSDFTNNGTLWGGKGLALTVSSLTNSANNVIGADHGNVTIHAQNGNVTNYGIIKNLDSDSGNLIIQAQNLMNDNGSILSNSNIDLQLSQNLTNQNNGEITAYSKGNILFTGSSFNNSYLMLAGGTITGTISGDINNNANGYIYGENGLTLTSTSQITNNSSGQIGTGAGNLSLTAKTLSFAQGGQIISSGGKISLNASSGLSNYGWLQGMGDIQITTPTLDNSNGTIVSMQGGMTIQKDQNGNGLTSLNNNNGTLQSTKDLTIYTNELQNQNGKILTYDALENGNLGDVTLFTNAQSGALTTLDLSNSGIIQSSKDINLAAQSSALSSTGTIIANQTLNAVLEGDFTTQNMFFSSSGINKDAGVNFTVHGNYTINEDEGIASRGNLIVTADNITNNGALIALNTMTIKTDNLINNVTASLSSSNDMNIIATGGINNQGIIQSAQGSMTIVATGDVYNIGGLIRTQSAHRDISLTANSFTNKYSGTLKPETVDTTKTYDTAVNADGQPYAGMTNKEFIDTYAEAFPPTLGSHDRNEYFYASDVKILQINVPDGMYTANGKPGFGYFYIYLSHGSNNSSARVEVTTTGTRDVLQGASAIISAGGNLTITTPKTGGKIINDVSHIEAGDNMTLHGESLDNHGLESSLTFTVACFNKDLCRQLNPKDTSDWATPGFNAHKVIGGGDSRRYAWGSTAVNNGLGSTIVAGEDLNGDFSGEVNNTTIIKNASPDDFATDNRSPSSGTYGETTGGDQGKDGLTGPGNGDLSSSGSGLKTVDGKDNTLGYGGVIAPQGVDPGLHVTLPGFKGSGSTSINDILSSLTGGQALFRPNPNVNGGNSSLNGVTSGGITGGGSNTGTGSSGGASNVSNNTTVGINGSPSVHSPTNSGDVVSQNNPTNTVTGTEVTVQNPVQSENINTSSVSSNSNYLIETRPQYTSVNEFYGSQYLLNRLDINGSYMFLGDAGFDTQYIQQQYIQATGQSYPGGTYMTASDAMKTLLNNASIESGKLGLQFGSALTSEQQAALDEDIVWYVPQVVDGQTVLVPQLYLSPKTDVLAGAAIKGKNVNITAGSIANSGLMEGTNSIALTATNGDISNIGGTIKGGNISLNAQNGSVINSDTVNNYLVNGGAGSYLGSQGQILASGTLGIQASDSIATHGGTIQSGSDLAMKAGTINIGSIELNAAASSVTHASDGTLSFVGNQTKNYGTTITAGGNASLQSTSGDLTLSGSTLNATGNVSLSSAGNIGLNAVTDSGLSDVKGKKSGAFNSSSFSDHNEYSTALSSNVISNGNIMMGAKNDINLAGSVVLADGNASLYAGHDVNLGSVTNTSSTLSSHKSSGLLQTEKEAGNSTKTEEIGSLVGAGKDITIGAGHDLNVTGTVTAKNDVTLIAGNNLSTMATKDTTDDYYHKSTSGLGASFSGGLASVGYQSNKQTDTNKTTTWTSSEISAGHNLTSVSGGSSTFTGTTLSAGNDLSISGSSVNFDTVHNTVDQTHKESSVFGGLKVGLSSNSAAGQAAQYGQAAVDMNGPGSAAGKTLNAMQGGYAVGNALANDGGGYSEGLASVVVQAGFNKSKYKSEYSQSTVVGSSATAGNNLSVVARSDNANDAHNGDLTATGADLSGKNVTLSGNNVTLQSDWDTTHSYSKGSSSGGSVGYEFGEQGVSFGASGSGSQQHANGDSASAVNTTVSATDKVTITAPGKTTINGGVVSGNQISVDTGNLDIISPQDTSHYNSSSSQFGGGLKVSVPGGGTGWGANGNYANQTIKDDYQSTGKQQSGLYAGDGGVQVNVDDTTHLKGGVISSTGGNSYLDTGKLITENQENHSKWDATSTGGGLNLGPDALGGPLGPLGVIAGNMAANSGLITGGNRKQNDSSTTQSAISSEVKVNAGSTEGGYTTDVASADGHMDNNFDANKLSNELQNSQLGMQLVGEVMGQVSDALHNSGLPGFDETNVTNDWGRIIFEAAGSAAVAGTTGGNVGSAAASSAVSTATIAATGQFIADNAVALAGGDKEVAEILTNIGMNIVASGAGAATGAATGGSSGAINGASIASDLQQYNAAGGKLAEKLVEVALKAAQKAAQLSGNKTLINLTKDINKIDDVAEAIEHSAVGKKIQDVNDAIGDAEFKAAEKVKDAVTGGKTSNDSSTNVTVEEFFKDARYTDKVKQQASSGDYHSFPESVDGFSGQGKVTEIVGGDGVHRLKLDIPGEYGGKTGNFEYIKNPDGTINHRLFSPN